MKLLTTFFLILACSFAQAASLTTNEVFVRLQTVIESGKGMKTLKADLEDLEEEELLAILKDYDQKWPQIRDHYFRAYQDFVTKSNSDASKADAKRQIKQHRADFMKIYALDEVSMKPLLKKTSMPAMEALRKLIMPNMKEVFATAPLALEQQRKTTLLLAKFRDLIVDTALLPDEVQSEKALIAAEKGEIAKLGGLPRDGLRIMADNDKIAAKEEIPDDEREGIREVNEWRLLLGLNALIIDSKLCDASRGHSEDMNKKGFFAHESPIPGKTTPWDRAGKAGTRARGENIYMGSPTPAAANLGWFYSPGHHKNMFKTGHKTIGLGRYERHWTQMFG